MRVSAKIWVTESRTEARADRVASPPRGMRRGGRCAAVPRWLGCRCCGRPTAHAACRHCRLPWKTAELSINQSLWVPPLGGARRTRTAWPRSFRTTPRSTSSNGCELGGADPCVDPAGGATELTPETAAADVGGLPILSRRSARCSELAGSVPAAAHRPRPTTSPCPVCDTPSPSHNGGSRRRATLCHDGTTGTTRPPPSPGWFRQLSRR